ETGDEDISKTGIDIVKKLNEKYKQDEDIFFYFQRKRQYNDIENTWMGWERKRGKLLEFNRLIREDKNTTYNIISSDIKNLMDAKYVITLDCDTNLPRNAAEKLIGAMCNPLNKPIIKDEMVIRGYTIMQPRIKVSSECANRTPYSKIFSGETGFDMYTTAISDVYQDMFHEGIFTGKGIYEVDSFNKLLDKKIPENSVLSHDLLEGCLTRCGLLTDVELIDGFPANYIAYGKRLHRWVRGDWQLMVFLENSKLNKLSKWKIIDNLRRSLVVPSILILILFSILLLPQKEIFLIIAFASLICPIIFDVSDTVVAPIKGIGLSGDFLKIQYIIEQFFLIFSFLPYQGYLMIDAIGRTLVRVFITKKNMLQWQTSMDVEEKEENNIYKYIKKFIPSLVITLVILISAYLVSYEIFLDILLTCVFWILSPITAYYISIDYKTNKQQLNREEKKEFRKISRKTFAYFEDFVNKDTNYIAPDNFQEEPYRGLAMRTSPTNIGMTLLANVAAYDMGYLGVASITERLKNSLNSIDGLEMYKGHFYNWYDIENMTPLYPKYISTVDSGNLAGYLWVIEEGLKDIIADNDINKNFFRGLRDVVDLSNEEIYENLNIKDYFKLEDDIEKENILSLLIDMVKKSATIEKKNNSEFYWCEKLKDQCLSYIKDIYKFYPEYRSNSKNRLIYVKAKANINEYGEELYKIVKKLDQMVKDMDFSILYSKNKDIFSIGYNIERDALDGCYYDLLASESRQASFVAISKGDVNTKHWFNLGRPTAYMGNKSRGLVSWSGTMFEYLMPLLIMKNFKGSLLDQTYKSVVEGQEHYLKNQKIPWGISESAYYNFDLNMNYQYKAFGVPGIGLKRGLANELVISPYATILASMVDFKASILNMKRISEYGGEGRYGFYEAIDFTKGRATKGKIVKCFMVHHLGMSLLALDNVLNNDILQNRFHRIPQVIATELLLEERNIKKIVYNRENGISKDLGSYHKVNDIVRNYSTCKNKEVETLLLSNGETHLMITNSGSGYCKNNEVYFYRWRQDSIKNDLGSFIYVKDVDNDDYFSSTYQPCKKNSDKYRVCFNLDKAEFHMENNGINTDTEITLSEEDNCEVKKMTIKNEREDEAIIEITSYLEVTIAPYNQDLVHPAFSNLFINTDYIEELETLYAFRRPRQQIEKNRYLMQTVAVQGEEIGLTTFESSRFNFIGRGGNLTNPYAMQMNITLKNTKGIVIDPIIAIRKRIKIKPHKSAIIAFTTAYCDTIEQIMVISKKYKYMEKINRTFQLSKIEKDLELKYLSLKASEANLFQLMAAKIIYINSTCLKREDNIKNITLGQSSLWAYGISGDSPIVLLKISKDRGINLLNQTIKAYEYLTMKGLKLDVVVLSYDNSTYSHPMYDRACELTSCSNSKYNKINAGSLFIFQESSLDKEVENLLFALARIVLDSSKGSIMSQIKEKNYLIEDNNIITKKEKAYNSKSFSYEKEDLIFNNSYGGFNEKDRTYDIILKDYKNTPAPWCNVIANKNFGFLISEMGVAYSWCKNSRENKISSWSNDPVKDGEGELFYLRDEETGDIFSITPKPIRDKGEYIVKHGFGYSTFKHYCNGIVGELTCFVSADKNVKVSIIKLRNNSSKDRIISVTAYVDLVMGVVKENTTQNITSYFNKDKNYVYCKNPYNIPFKDLIAYIKIYGGEKTSYTASRDDFIGKCGSLEAPNGLEKKELSSVFGAGFDPCLCSQSKIKIKKEEEKYIYVILGEEDNTEKIDQIISEYENREKCFNELNITKKYWEEILNKIQVKTPDKSFDLLVNGYLLYQSLCCRILSRTGFYQCGGAFGFRDQLQDVMSLHYIDPSIEREHILYSASRQFLEGDVQHWWHPYVESGIRTKFSDDLLWLPYVVIDYIKTTNDRGILEEKVAYIEDSLLGEYEDERYSIARKSNVEGSIYDHCTRAIERSLKFGSHNIPLMGSGDWNDGMNQVGNKGLGESVWLGWFIASILKDFIPICEEKQDLDRVIKYKETLEFIKKNIDKNAWDGDWYRRAYFDNGAPLGSSSNTECRIDSLSQSWSVISGAGDIKKSLRAMKAVEDNLYLKEKGMLLLLTPPFNKSKLEPGYIKGYVPGVRENGGQYTHASVWVILAEIMLKKGDLAYEMFSQINPINHSNNKLACEIYKVEPYVMTADIYAKEPHVGRGGWSYYTGAAGWMYRVSVEGILGLKVFGDNLIIDPCIPDSFNEFEIRYKWKNSVYEIKVERGDKKGLYLDGEKMQDSIHLEDDSVHKILMKI
ncbi:MAG: GH36-type glycosyl hydrolase domain-containing protein, partial [Clostridiaceae bacterium]